MRLAKYKLNFEFIEIHYKDIILNPNNVLLYPEYFVESIKISC